MNSEPVDDYLDMLENDEREEPECWYCDDKGFIEVLAPDGFTEEPCPACKGVEG